MVRLIENKLRKLHIQIRSDHRCTCNIRVRTVNQVLGAGTYRRMRFQGISFAIWSSNQVSANAGMGPARVSLLAPTCAAIP